MPLNTYFVFRAFSYVYTYKYWPR